jgi:phosphoribosylaminoimidazolecarboxamide formyltransferase/IMP cyclohydrolase
MKIEWALISVSNKDGLSALARGLGDLGIRCLSTGGTARALLESGIEVTPVSDYTGFPEILDGRVKTLHPRIHAGILARHDLPHHREVLTRHAIQPLGLVVVNLYPFVQTVSREGVTLEDAIEQIDIGGPCMVRAAAKNWAHVTVVVDPSDYTSVLAELAENGGRTRKSTRLSLARKAFRHTAHYDTAISQYLEEESGPEAEIPATVTLSLDRQDLLRYGENPHQRAAIYRPTVGPPQGLAGAVQLQGKQLSFNNYLDLDAAWGLVSEFEETSCIIIKHNNPCGAALGADPREAYVKALECDPVSAFGSILAFNRPVDAATAEATRTLFVEAIIAPAYSQGALEIFARKKNLRVMRLEPQSSESSSPSFDLKMISGACLLQDADLVRATADDLKVVTRRPPEPGELQDLLFAWAVAKHVKSNAIVFAEGGQTVGIGAGQMSRVDSVRLAAQKAQRSTAGASMASDAFFPFRDGLDEAAESGITAVIQPGGSVRDAEVIEAADEHGMAMVFTGMRHFRH